MCVKLFLILCCTLGVFAQNGGIISNGDGSNSIVFKSPVEGNDVHKVGVVGGAHFSDKNNLASATAGLVYSNAFGHGVSLTDTHQPGFGDKLTAAGKVNLFHNDDHNLDARASLTRNMPDHPHIPEFNTVGGGVDYMFKDKVGASLSASHSAFINRNDFSVGANMNLMRTPSSSLDFNAGVEKFNSPFLKSDWAPKFSLSFRANF